MNSWVDDFALVPPCGGRDEVCVREQEVTERVN